MSRFTDARDDVAERSHETTDNQKTRAEGWLNESKDVIQSEFAQADWLQATIDYNTVASQTEYPLSDISSGETWDITRIRSIRIPDKQSTLTPVDPEEFDLHYPEPGENPGEPEIYTVWNEVLLLAPQPNAVYSLEIKVYRDIPDFSTVGNETPPWPKRYDGVWKHYALYLAYDFNDDERADKYLGRFFRGVSRMKGGDSTLMRRKYRFARASRSGRIYRGPGYPRFFPAPYGG